MYTVLLIDRSNPFLLKLTRHLAGLIINPEIKILLLSDRHPSSVISSNFEIFNISDAPQSYSFIELQDKFDFSLHKLLVTERAYFDYSSFRKNQCYSNLSLEQAYESSTQYLNALDFLIREKVDLVIEGLADNFVTTAAGLIAYNYNKKFFMVFLYYWWLDGVFFLDRLNQTSSEIDSKYSNYMASNIDLDISSLQAFYKRQLFRGFLEEKFRNMYNFKIRLLQILNKFKSYDKPSFGNFLSRKCSRFYSKIMISLFIKFERSIYDEKYILFPLHVTPEASLLGNDPELADQFSLIKNISMNLPAGVKLYVKDHPHQEVGLGLNYDFYRKLATLPNVRLFGKRCPLNAKAIYMDPGCLAVSVISGTIGLEAALELVPVFVFGHPIYGASEYFIKPNNFDEFYTVILSIYRGKYILKQRALYAMLQAQNDSVVKANVNFSKAKGWVETSYLVNVCIAEFINKQFSDEKLLRK